MVILIVEVLLLVSFIVGRFQKRRLKDNNYTIINFDIADSPVSVTEAFLSGEKSLLWVVSVAYILTAEGSVDVDTALNLELATLLLKRRP